jgi:hypothetical protein
MKINHDVLLITVFLFLLAYSGDIAAAGDAQGSLSKITFYVA